MPTTDHFDVELDAFAAAKNITLTVKVRRLRRWQFRLVIAMWLARIARRLAGFKIELVEMGEREQ